jgi:long-chain fatty acid transport protein
LTCRNPTARAFAIASALVLILSLPTFAYPQINQAFEEYGVGPRDAAMGNAFAGVSDDFAAAFYNPAGLSQVKGVDFTVGYKLLVPEVNAKMDGYGKDRFTKYPVTEWGLFGMASDLNMPNIINPKYTDRFSVGLAVALCNFIHSYTNYYDEHTPYFYRYQDRPVALLSAYVGFGVKITDWASLGGGFALAPSMTYVAAQVKTDVYLPEGDFVANQGTINRSYAVVDPVIGLMFKIPMNEVEDFWRIGITWRDEVQVLDGFGHALNRLIIHGPTTDQTMEPVAPQDVPVVTLSGYSPHQVLLGLGVKPAKGTVVAADGIWKHWSAWENYFLNQPDPSFEDTFQGRLGVEQRIFTESAEWLDSLALRAGGYYEPSPVPNQDGDFNILDNDKYVFTGGLGFRFDELFGVFKLPIDLDVNAQAHYLVPETITNDRDEKFPEIETDGMVYSGAAAVSIAW